jgi:hypothetical protein
MPYFREIHAHQCFAIIRALPSGSGCHAIAQRLWGCGERSRSAHPRLFPKTENDLTRSNFLLPSIQAVMDGVSAIHPTADEPRPAFRQGESGLHNSERVRDATTLFITQCVRAYVETCVNYITATGNFGRWSAPPGLN